MWKGRGLGGDGACPRGRRARGGPGGVGRWGGEAEGGGPEEAALFPLERVGRESVHGGVWGLQEPGRGPVALRRTAPCVLCC